MPSKEVVKVHEHGTIPITFQQLRIFIGMKGNFLMIDRGLDIDLLNYRSYPIMYHICLLFFLNSGMCNAILFFVIFADQLNFQIRLTECSVALSCFWNLECIR